MSVDNVIKVWDLRTNKCTQTITHEMWPQSEDAQALGMVYDSGRKRLITASRRPFMWQHKLIMKDRTGHRSACVKAVYNSTFYVVVSVDDSKHPLCTNYMQGFAMHPVIRSHGMLQAKAVSSRSDFIFGLDLGPDGVCCLLKAVVFFTPDV